MLDALARGLRASTPAGWARFRVAAVLVLAGASPLAAQTTDPLFAGWRWAPPSVGSRPAGMGGAFVGLADEAKAAVANPAGLSLIPITEVGVSSGEPWLSLAVGNPRLRFAGYLSRTEEAHVDLGEVTPARVGSLDSSTWETGLALGISVTPRLKVGGSIAATRLELDGERRVPGPGAAELTTASVTAEDTRVRGSAGLLLVLVGANTGALPSLRLGVSWQPGFDWSGETTDATTGTRALGFRRPTLVSTGLAWRASDRWSVVGQGDVILYSEVLKSLERNVGEAAFDFALPSSVEPRLGAEFSAPLWCGCGIVHFRGGLHYRSPGTLHYVGPDPILRRTFTQGTWRTVSTLGASLMAEHFGNALRLDIDVRDVFDGPDLSFGVVWRF